MRYAWLVIFLCSALLVSGQYSDRIRQMEQQLKDAQAEIEITNKLLSEATRTAQTSLNRLNLLSTQLLNRRKIITLLNQEVTAIDNQMASMQREINQLEKELAEKRENYGKSIRNMSIRRNSQDKLLFILSADDFMQSIRRMRYLREYADWQKRQALDVIEKQKEVAEKKQALEKTREDKQSLLAVREQEQKKLQTEEAGQKVEVQNLNRRRQQLQSDLNKKRQQAAALDKTIEKLIEEEIARAEAARKAAEKSGTVKPGEERVASAANGYAMTQAERQLSNNFEENRGRLPAPVSAGYTIVSSFGEHQHQELRHVRTNNNGIDLQTSPGTDARSVFDGEVTRIFVVPGYNNSIIVRHGNYLTVYSNLSQVYVKQGDKVKTRQALGRVFTDEKENNATILHFELRKEKTKLNPTLWITR